MRILGELGAVESVPYLIEHTNWGVTYTESLSHFYAYRAIIDIDKAAVPDLRQALTLEPDDYRRQLVARALVSIEGCDAIPSLEVALDAERNAENREILVHMIDGLNAERESKRGR